MVYMMKPTRSGNQAQGFTRRRGETSWQLPHRPGSTAAREYPFSLRPVAFPREVTQVFDAILLRAAWHADVTSVEVEDAVVPSDGAIWVSVGHVGERIPFVPIGRPYLRFIKMFDGFPGSRYEIEINDGDQKLNYKQVLSPSRRSGNTLCFRKPIIQRSEDSRNWTKVTFKPDFTVFNLTNSDASDIQHTVWKRSVDVAGTMGGTMGNRLKVRLRGHDLDIYNFYPGYVRLYPPFALERRRSFAPERIHDKPTCSNPNHRWEVCVSWSHGEFEQISFVNGLPTDGGGTHVELVKKKLMNYAEEIKAKYNIRFDSNNKKKCGVGYDSRFDIEDICVFINLFINKPIFHSNVTDRLAKEFEESYELGFSTQFLSLFVNQIMGNRPLGLPGEIQNLVDAREAGRAHSSKCYLILTNGQSKILSGLTLHDRKFYGVLSLEGKIPNAKTAHNMAFENKDVKNIIASLGLEKGVRYKNAKKLRYAHVILMMNQDNDGAHVKGLIITLLHTWWPSLLLQKNFMFQFLSPIIKVEATHHEEKHEFFSVQEYNQWTRSTEDYAKWTTKFYKSLGAHTSEETKEYFKNKSQQMQAFHIYGLHDSNAIDLVFSNDRVNDRKDWIMTFEEGGFLDLQKESITYEDFFKKELIFYFIGDMKRSIPSMVDGLKPLQRKVVLSAFNKNLVDELKVCQFADYICEQCAFNHGKDKLSETIISMAQNFVGSNNINLFLPIGQFGTRRKGGKFHSDPRHITTCLSPLTRMIFPKDDDTILNYIIEDGQSVQPTWYLPIIPMVLVNGCEGTTSGWSTNLTKYDPWKIIAYLKCVITGRKTTPLIPWFRGFKGTVEELEAHPSASFEVNGVVNIIEFGTIEITELPPCIATGLYKYVLEDLVGQTHIKSFQEVHIEDNVKFIVTFTREKFEAAQQEGFLKVLRLIDTITTDNMYLIDRKGSLHKYLRAEEIISDFYALRLPYYQKRKDLLVAQYADDIKRLRNIARFVHEYNNDKINWKLDLNDFIQQLRDRGYDCLLSDSNFSYICKLTIDDLELERTDVLARECKLVEAKLVRLEKQQPSDLWIADLEVLEKHLDIIYKEEGTEDTKLHQRKKRRKEI